MESADRAHDWTFTSSSLDCHLWKRAPNPLLGSRSCDRPLSCPRWHRKCATVGWSPSGKNVKHELCPYWTHSTVCSLCFYRPSARGTCGTDGVRFHSFRRFLFIWCRIHCPSSLVIFNPFCVVAEGHGQVLPTVDEYWIPKVIDLSWAMHILFRGICWKLGGRRVIGVERKWLQP